MLFIELRCTNTTPTLLHRHYMDSIEDSTCPRRGNRLKEMKYKITWKCEFSNNLILEEKEKEKKGKNVIKDNLMHPKWG